MSNLGVFIHDSSVRADVDGGEPASELLFKGVIRKLKQRGFTVGKDPRIEREHKILSRWHREATYQTKQGTLYISMHFFPRGVEFKAWQNVNHVNPHGGKYDFDKLAKMPYLIRMACLKFQSVAVDYITSQGLALRPQRRRYQDDPLGAFNDCWEASRFKRDESGWPDASELRSWKQIDANGVPMTQGSFRYVLNYDGRWWKVRVYGGINGMWLGVCKDAIVNRNASEFHSVVSKRDLRRRTFDRSTIRNRVTKRIEAAFSESAKSRNWRKCDALASMAEKFGLTLVANAKLVAT
jgi:hypothetical protein